MIIYLFKGLFFLRYDYNVSVYVINVFVVRSSSLYFEISKFYENVYFLENN